MLEVERAELFHLIAVHLRRVLGVCVACVRCVKRASWEVVVKHHAGRQDLANVRRLLALNDELNPILIIPVNWLFNADRNGVSHVADRVLRSPADVLLNVAQTVVLLENVHLAE